MIQWSFPGRSWVAATCAAGLLLTAGCHGTCCAGRVCCQSAGSACCADSASACDAAKQAEEKLIRAVLDKQRDDWNKGDIEGFMQGYCRSDQLSFASGGTITRGWDETLARYRQRYPDKTAMGTLSFDNVEVRVAHGPYALVTGHWRLERDKPVEGVFSLVFEKMDDRWVIIHDHTSAGP